MSAKSKVLHLVLINVGLLSEISKLNDRGIFVAEVGEESFLLNSSFTSRSAHTVVEGRDSTDEHSGISSRSEAQLLNTGLVDAPLPVLGKIITRRLHVLLL